MKPSSSIRVPTFTKSVVHMLVTLSKTHYCYWTCAKCWDFENWLRAAGTDGCLHTLHLLLQWLFFSNSICILHDTLYIYISNSICILHDMPYTKLYSEHLSTIFTCSIYMHSTHATHIYITVKRFRLHQPCFGHLSCIPSMCVTRKVQGMLTIWKSLADFLNFQHFLWGLLFLSLILHSCPWRVPRLHGCGSNTRNVAK